MSKYLQAADDARRLLRGFAAVSELADAFEEVGVLEQRADELRAAADALAQERDALILAVADAQAAVATAQADATRTVADARAVADGIVNTANAEAAGIAQTAKDTLEAAQSEVKNLREQLSAEQADHATHMLEYSKQVAELEARAEKARQYLAKLAG